MSTTTPTLKVEIAFDDTPLTVSPTWTDVTSYVRDDSCKITRGRPSETDVFSAGQCTLTLNNRGGVFSPLNLSSPYNGKLLPGKQIRVTATWSSVDYTLFRGFITGWPQRYASGKRDAVVPITAYDALSKLNDIELSDRMVPYVESLADVTSYYVGFDNNKWTDLVGSRTASLIRGTAVSSDSIAPGMSTNSIYCVRGRLSFTPLANLTATSGAYGFWIKTSNTGSTTSSFLAIASGPILNYTSRPVIGIDVDGLVRYQSWDSSFPGLTPLAQSQVSIADNVLHHVVVLQESTGPTIYVDGVDATDYTNGYAAESSYIGTMRYIGSDGSGSDQDFTGYLQDFTVWFDGVPSADEVKRIYELGTSGYTTTTTDHLNAVLDDISWPSGLRSVATNTYGQMRHSWVRGDGALSEAQAVAVTEQGRFFASRDGKITLLSRYTYLVDSAGSTIQATFSDDGSDARYMEIGFDYDDLRVRNEIRVTGASGVTVSASDSASIDAYGRQSESITTFLPLDTDTQQMAYGLIGQRKDPQVRALPMVATAQTTTSMWSSILALDLGQRVRFEITPPGAGSQSQLSQLIEQLDWDISQSLWLLTITGSPIPTGLGVYDTAVYDSAVYGF